jgi:MYXO-CTERM domain-containing protein
MIRSHRLVLVAALAPVLAARLAYAHFALTAPPAYSVQDAQGTPLKSAPCGQADPGNPLVATGAVSTFHEGDMVTITINETIFHPGHYRVALAQTQGALPADPAVLADANSPCGTATVQTAATPGVLIDGQLDHTAAFAGAQSFQVKLPMTECQNCVLQVVEFMSNHPLNNPGGCFYHHCATVNVVPVGTAIPDAGTATAPDAGTTGGGTTSGGCAVGGGEASGWLALGLAGLVAARRRRA